MQCSFHCYVVKSFYRNAHICTSTWYLCISTHFMSHSALVNDWLQCEGTVRRLAAKPNILYGDVFKNGSLPSGKTNRRNPYWWCTASGRGRGAGVKKIYADRVWVRNHQSSENGEAAISRKMSGEGLMWRSGVKHSGYSGTYEVMWKALTTPLPLVHCQDYWDLGSQNDIS